MSQRRSDHSNAGENLNEDAVKECVRFILCREGGKVPIKRGEIVKHLSTTCQLTSNQVNAAIVGANKILKKVYGCKIVQVDAKSGGIQYIIVLSEPCQSEPSSITESHHRKLLVAALTHIYMSGGPVKEEEMWKFLIEAGLLEETDHTSRKILTNTFTRQLYLQYTKVGIGELARNVFEWGQRATEEVPKMFLLNKMAQAFEKSPDHWCEQYKEATEEAH